MALYAKFNVTFVPHVLQILLNDEDDRPVLVRVVGNFFAQIDVKIVPIWVDFREGVEHGSIVDFLHLECHLLSDSRYIELFWLLFDFVSLDNLLKAALNKKASIFQRDLVVDAKDFKLRVLI